MKVMLLKSLSITMGVVLILILIQLVHPFSCPPIFVAGTHVDPRSNHDLRQNAARYMATDAASTPSSANGRLSVRDFLLRLKERRRNPLPPPKKPGWKPWKGEEPKSPFLSRLLFNYVTDLLQTASHRHLDAGDAFDLPQSRTMERSVTRLRGIYGEMQDRSRRELELQKAKGEEHAVNAQALLLTKALLRHQRRVLLYSGVLRLINTLIQAFPALLVARLLRLVEAGNANPVYKALQAAITLVLVLSLKMITENQFFHNVVKCSTQVRGSLAGMIFDKSLRLSAGGSGVTHVQSITKKENNAVAESIGIGGVMNLMQSDASIIESAALQIHTLWDGPLQIAIYTSLLFRYLGPSVVWGIGVLLLIIPVNSVTLRILNKYSKYENEAKDARTRRTAESISNMKLLKLQGWEQRFADDIRKHRSEELRRHVSRGFVKAVNSAISNAVPALVLVVTLRAYVKTGRPIVASTIFTAISLFNQLRFPLFFYPMLIDSLANGKNAMRRIASYLSAEEIVPYVLTLPPAPSGGSIEMKNGNFLWSTQQSLSGSDDSVEGGSPALRDVNLKVNPGEIVAVVGTVGSGKSALIKGLLGELNPVPRTIVQEHIAEVHEESNFLPESGSIIQRPSVIRHGDVAYCSQEAWLPKGTIRDAIVFGREYDDQRYRRAIRDAGLDEDIVDDIGVSSAKGTLTHDTDVGEGGASLSGGQRARVALARALYGDSQTKVFLLDDCLAALDANVGSVVFQRLSVRLREAGAATILVTNDPSLPRRCDRVILMEKISSTSPCATIADEGTYDELISRGHDMRSISTVDEHVILDLPTSASPEIGSSESFELEAPKLMQIGRESVRVVGGYEAPRNMTECSLHADPECQIAMENCPDFIASMMGPTRKSIQSEPDMLEDSFRKDDSASVDVLHNGVFARETQRKAPDIRKLSADDAMSAEAVPSATYVSYFKAVRMPLLVVAMIASYFIANSAQFFQQYTVATWTEIARGTAMADALGAKYLSSLVNAALVVSAFLWLRSVLLMQVGVRASDYLHSRMLNSVFSAPMSFFDATPSGQLLSRFGKEMETVDRSVPESIGSVFFCFMQIFMSIGAIAGVVTPAMAIPFALVSFLYVRTMALFRPATRDMKRAETKTRSPIYTHFGEALRGTDTIRSIPGAQEYWSSIHRNLTDVNLAVFFTVKAFDRWLSMRLETLGNTVVFTAAVAAVYLTRSGSLKAGSAGWGLTQALAITGLLTWAVRCLTDLETNMMSVIRVKELSDLDSEEADLRFVQKSGRRMPKEPSIAGEALLPLLPAAASINTTMSSLDSDALIKDGWPWRGNVQFTNVSMRYNSASPLILKGVTLTVPAGNTLGIVGRTGSGKSSLLLTLFRLVEVEAGGCIEIDGVDIRGITLDALRRSLAIIPQSPVLFAGSIAYNLDATGKASPEDMWQALEAASPSLAEQFKNSNGLETYVSEGGDNLSLGQRQLICLARALLRKSKILVLDEATSSVDPITDKQVQDTIKREFVDKGVTVITVAHRLETVLGYDKIAVLGDGKVLEYGSPQQLLSMPYGEFRQLYDADRRNRQYGSERQQEKVKASAT